MKEKLILMYPAALLLGTTLALASWRVPIPVTELKVLCDCFGQPSYYVCPRCGLTMEREFASFCDRCGQRLGWRSYRNAKIIYCCPGRAELNLSSALGAPAQPTPALHQLPHRQGAEEGADPHAI